MNKFAQNRMTKIIGVAAALVLTFAAFTMTWADAKKMKTLPEGWRNFIHVKSMIIPDKNHGLYGFHHIYVNDKGLPALKKGGAYPEGSIFVGAFYDIVTEKDGTITQGKKLFHVYMKKSAKATETGGWKYAAFDPDGKDLQKDVKTECFECHSAAKDTDYIYSKFIE